MTKKTTADNSLIKTIERRLNNYISDCMEAQKTIIAAYLFGSALYPQKFQSNSDIDLAFLLERSLYKEDPLINSAPAYMAATEIGLMLERQTDVIILNSASIETAYQSLTTGRLIYEADHESRLEYEAVLRGLYFDFKPFLEKLRAKSMRHPDIRESAT